MPKNIPGRHSRSIDRRAASDKEDARAFDFLMNQLDATVDTLKKDRREASDMLSRCHSVIYEAWPNVTPEDHRKGVGHRDLVDDINIFLRRTGPKGAFGRG